ncbi:hypothetical protein ACFWN7_09530 [Agromyces sp. NPDC058484]|uniref:hypothetical protein n=1 Tax=Agromyces sp. NPDC058484 TaxID=3346524 RepID=UPI00365485B0
MNRRKAAPVIATVSLVVLLSGCAGSGAPGGGNAERADAARAASAEARRDSHAQRSVESRFTTAWSAEARREFHGQSAQPGSARTWSAEALREFHGQSAQPGSARTWSAEALREFHGQSTTAQHRALSPAAIRELKGSVPVEVDDVLSPLEGRR